PFLPTTLDEARARGWDELDVVLVTGDAYVDHPSFGAAVIGRVLEAAGYRVGILPQPDWRSAEAFRALGRPRLFFGITSGAMDSMVNRYTAHKRPRRDDAYSPGGVAGKRPDRATTVYAHRCREAFREVPIVLGGVEASLRRLAHYDYWDDRVRRSVLFDSKADILVYGQGEKPILQLAARLAAGVPISQIDDVAGTAVIRRDWQELAARWDRPVVELPSFEEIAGDKLAYARFSKLYHLEHNPENARLLVQRHGDRAVVVLPPMPGPDTDELDRIHALPFARAPHPRYRGERIPAWEQIRFSIQIVRGCNAGCSFCCITEHQGRDVCSRSPESVLEEVREVAVMPEFRGTISDLGGPTANLWGARCGDARAHRMCRRASCLFPTVCSKLVLAHDRLVELYRAARRIPGVKHTFIGSGVRYDGAQADSSHGERYLRELVAHHVSGQLKVAPEHVSARVLRLMRKPAFESFGRFREQFERFSREAGKQQYLVPYFISSHPGSTLEDAAELHDFLRANNWRPQQVQDFTPTPMTLATDMFHSGIDPTTMEPLPVDRDLDAKRMQKALMRWADPDLAPWYRRAMQALGRAPAATRQRPEQLPRAPRRRGR
ncbi:MAG: YgiQ family radical SAM protein, partial [Myxococcales bacterium]